MSKRFRNLIILAFLWASLSFAQDESSGDGSDSSGAPANLPSQKESPILDAGNYSVPAYPQNN